MNELIPLTPEQLKQLKENDPYKLFEGLVAVYLPPMRPLTEQEQRDADEFFNRQFEVHGTKPYVIPQELLDKLSAPVGLKEEE